MPPTNQTRDDRIGTGLTYLQWSDTNKKAMLGTTVRQVGKQRNPIKGGKAVIHSMCIGFQSIGFLCAPTCRTVK